MRRLYIFKAPIQRDEFLLFEHKPGIPIHPLAAIRDTRKALRFSRMRLLRFRGSSSYSYATLIPSSFLTQ
jgi:hypothetical protein